MLSWKITTTNPFSVQEIADALKGTNIPVMVKNPVNQDLALWIGALERIAGAGINKIAAIHRGFSTGDTSKYRNLPLWKIPIELKSKFPSLPLICDPSHIAGKRDLIAYVCQKAMDADMDGLMVETHIDPSVALSDAAQQVTPEALNAIIEGLSLRTEFGLDRTFEQELDTLRSQVDRVDQSNLRYDSGAYPSQILASEHQTQLLMRTLVLHCLGSCRQSAGGTCHDNLEINRS